MNAWRRISPIRLGLAVSTPYQATTIAHACMPSVVNPTHHTHPHVYKHTSARPERSLRPQSRHSRMHRQRIGDPQQRVSIRRLHEWPCRHRHRHLVQTGRHAGAGVDWGQVKQLIDCTQELRELVAPGGAEDLFSGGGFPDLLPSLHSEDSSGGSADEDDLAAPGKPPAAPRCAGLRHR